MPTSTDTTATAVTDEAASRLPKLIAWLEGRMMFKEAADVRAILTAALPHIRPTAEPVATTIDDEDDALIEEVAKAIALHGFGRPWDDFEEVNAYDTDHGDLREYARAAIYASPLSALVASPAQQEPVAIKPLDDWTLRKDGDDYWLSMFRLDGKSLASIHITKPHWSDADLDALAARIRSALASAPDMREVVLALEAAHPHLETLHSITSGEGRKIVWAVIKQVRAALHTRGDASHG